MLAKKSIKNPIRLSKTVASRADEVRAGLKKLGINERDIAASVCWVRKAK